MITRKRQLLAVDDNPVNLEVLAEILGDQFQLLLAESGQEAIEIASQHEPEVILLDVMMPKMDGLETCRLLRNIPRLANSVIIIVSAKAMPSEREAGLRAGAHDYLTKPFDEQELLAVLDRHCRTEKGSDGAAERGVSGVPLAPLF
jgi:CheY-like chemotaxis protein